LEEEFIDDENDDQVNEEIDQVVDGDYGFDVKNVN
jgi:hypothetical protein